MDTVFADGLYVRMPSEKAPEFIKMNLSVKVDEFAAFLNQHADEEGYVKLTVKESKKGSVYVQLDTWKPEEKKQAATAMPAAIEYPTDEINPDDIPF